MLVVAVLSTGLPTAALAAAAGATAHPPAVTATADIVVTGQRLDAARASVSPALGASAYSVDNATIQALPGGDNQPLDAIILQLPGVAQDGFGQFHVRDDHNGLQYRINGTVLPEGLAVFGQTLSPRLIDRFTLLTGALPAQYGLRTAGIIDITTKTGFRNGGQVSIYGGAHGTIEPSVEYGGSTGSTNYYVSGSYRHNDMGIENVDASRHAIHDRTDQGQAFAYVDHILNDQNRISFVGGYSNQWFQIPNPRGQQPALGFSVGGRSDFRSEDLDERQLERTGFGQLAWLHHGDRLTVQTALFARYSALIYRPDVTGELLFNGQAQRATKRDFAAGLQIDAAWRLADAHTLRFGALASRDRGYSRTNSFVFPDNDPTAPFSLAAQAGKTEWTISAYLQDEWKLSPSLTFNYGARFDRYDGYRAEQQLSPRANLVWQPGGGATLHIGYARYFSPPPFGLVSTTAITALAGTSAAPPGTANTTPFAERQHYFDIGAEQKLAPGLTVSIDGYYRLSRNLIDEGQFGAPIILTPFNYRTGRVRGIEFSANYARGPWLAYANFAVAKAQGMDIVSSQFAFDPGDFAYIRDHFIFLDHDQRYTGSAGLSYAFRDGRVNGLQLGASMLYGSGLRTDGGVPNGGKLDPYTQINLSARYRLARLGAELRLDVINIADHVYEIRDGEGVGVGAPQFGPRRGVFIGISKDL